MDTERHVRLFKNGRNQALRIPRDLELPGREAILRKEGHRLVVEPVARPSLKSLHDRTCSTPTSFHTLGASRRGWLPLASPRSGRTTFLRALVCVTDNVAEFKRVPALKVENWLA